MADDLDLVRKYARERDARAFAEIASRYGGLVYGVCLRVTGSAHDAEDIAQDCFLKLAESAAAIDVPLARWLHTLARSRAVDAVRARAARRRHEEAAVGDRPGATEPTWDDVSAHVDDALAELPDELRDPLVLHFLLGRGQTDVAAELGVDQSTVSRRIDRGVGELREKLRKAGVVVSVALLATLLTDNAASAAVPATLTAALGKMALAGVGKGVAVAAGASAAGGAVVALKTKLVVAAAVGALAVTATVAYKVAVRETPSPPVTPVPGAERRRARSSEGERRAVVNETTKPDVTVTPVPGAKMTVRATGYGPGLAGTSHLRVGRREVTNWYDSPSGRLRETTESVVARKVTLLGRDCFEVRARSRRAGETVPYEETFEYFFVDAAGTHWVRPKEGRAPDLADDSAWETWDHLEGEGVSPVEVSTERPEANSTVEVVDLTIGGQTVRCLRETFFEVEGGRVRYGGDVFRREDGTSILYYRLLAEGMREYDALAGAPEYELGGATLRVWETVRLVEESDQGDEAAGRRDYSKLALEGEHWRDDSFSLVMRAVARLFGREADYETVFALSTNGFAPDVRPGDPCCKGTWRMFGRGRNMDVVAAYLGLAVRRLDFPEPPPLPAPDAQGRKWGTPAYNEWLDNRKKACAAVVREALGTGAVVIADGGWRNHEWFLWGVITEARPDGTIIGTTLSPPLKGDLDYCFMDHIRSYWTVTRADARLSQEEADLSMLRQAVARIRGDRAPFAHGKVLFGLPAMDRWIEQMRKPAFQEDDPASSAGNARVNADVSSLGARAVSAYLRRRMATFPEAARPHLEAAARHYDRIAGLLGPFAVWEDGKGYRALMGKTGDVEKQKAHAETVLVPVKRELAAAANEIEKALLAGMRGRLADIDLSGRGSGFERDTFCLAVQEAARILGRRVDYGTLLALTTNAFAPGFDTGNDCKELWVANAWVSHLGPIDTAWRHLGLRVEPLLHPEQPGDPATPKYGETMARLVRRAMAEGKVVVSCGGWDTERRWVEPWWAGIVTEVRDDLTVLGAHLNGRNDNVLKHLNGGELLAVSPAEPSLSVEESNVELLRHAVDRIRAKGKPGSFGRHEFCAFGVDAMDDWIAQMRGVPYFCPPCQKNKGTGHFSAFTVVRAVLHRCHEAAAFLRARAGTFPGPARPHIEAAAGQYERIVTLLRPATTPGGDDRYETFIGDLAKQKAHAETVLMPVKAGLARAADEMEKALIEARLRRDGDRVFITGLEKARWGGFTDRQNTVIAAMTEALRLMGEDVTFEYLMGVSGAAFRLHVARPEWCPSAPHATCGFDCSAPAAKAFGYSLAWHEVKEGDTERAGSRARAIVDSINDGRPALFNGIDCSVITGYVDGGKAVLLRRSGAKNDGYTPFSKWTWEGAGVLGRLARMPDRRASILESLRTAVKVAKTEEFDKYASGFAAYEKWAERLDDESKFEKLSAKDHKQRCFVNGWMYMSLAGDRKMAAAYMRKVAGEFEGEAARHLTSAADLYGRVRDLLFSKRDGFPNPYYLYPQDLDDAKGWTRKLRRTQAAILRDALELERRAVAEIEKALAASGTYRGAQELRDDLYGLMNGLDKAQELEWGRVFLRDAEGRAEELAKLCGKYRCTQVVVRGRADGEDTILWLNADGRIEAAFCYMPDAGDLEAFRDVYRRVERTDSPLTFVVLPQPGRKDTFDAHMISRRSCLEHSWELGIKAKAEPLPLAKGIRKELYEMFRTPADAPTSPLSKPERAYWSWRLSHSDEKAAAKLGRDAKHYGCTQSVDGGCILWKGADGKPAVMFRVVRDQADPKVLRQLYDRMISEDIPLAYCFVNAYRFDGTNRLGDWDVWSMSRQKAQVHCWRFWAHEARPEPGEAEPESDVF